MGFFMGNTLKMGIFLEKSLKIGICSLFFVGVELNFEDFDSHFQGNPLVIFLGFAGILGWTGITLRF